jgi:hypothetical protein
MENILLDQVLQQVQNKEISIEKARELICVLFDVVKQSEMLCKCTTKILPDGNIQLRLCEKCAKEDGFA